MKKMIRMPVLVQFYADESGDYPEGSLRIARMTTAPVGRCAICCCPLYSSVVLEACGTTAVGRDMGQHKKDCDNRLSGAVVRRSIEVEEART